MKSKHAFYTKTLTNLYVKQGYFEDSLKGFKALLQKDPDQEDLVRDLAGIKEKIRCAQKQKLVDLVAEWVGLLRSPLS